MGRDQAWLLRCAAIAAATIICAVSIRLWSGYPGNPKGETSLTVAVFIVVMAALVRFLLYLGTLWNSGCEHPLSRVRQDLPAAARGFLPLVLGILIIGSFLFSLSYLKSMITSVVPFWADAPLAASDRFLHIDAEAIALSLGSLLPALGFFYGLWHAAHLGGILWVLHWQKEDKARHIVSFMLTWSIGMFLAYIFSSAGPLFTGQFDPSIAPRSVQKPAEILWANYQANGALIGGGISAFPSMHVAIAAWIAIVMRDRGLAWLGFVFLGGIFAGSVILGWHYTLDGIAGIAVALVADRLSQAWLRSGRAISVPMGQPVAAPN